VRNGLSLHGCLVDSLVTIAGGWWTKNQLNRLKNVQQWPKDDLFTLLLINRQFFNCNTIGLWLIATILSIFIIIIGIYTKYLWNAQPALSNRSHHTYTYTHRHTKRTELYKILYTKYLYTYITYTTHVYNITYYVR